MFGEGHTVRPSRAGVAGRAIAWCAAIGGFAAYLVNLDSFFDACGGVGTGVLLLLWLTLFSVLRYMTPDKRPVPAPHHTPAAIVPPPIAPPQSAIVDRVDLLVAPSAALRNATAQGRMMSVLGIGAAGLSERETDLMDWGFAFGVAWAIARAQDPVASEELVSDRALQATQAVYEAYRGSRAPMPGSAPHTYPHGGGSPDPGDLRTQDEPARLAREAQAL